MKTRPSLITRWPDRAMQLDWLLLCGVAIDTLQFIPALDVSTRPLSDYGLITCRITGLGHSHTDTFVKAQSVCRPNVTLSP